MYSLISNRGKVTYNIQKFIVDLKSDLADLPIDGAPGSKALVIETGDIYILNNEKVWVLLPQAGGGIDPTATYIYDGGII